MGENTPTNIRLVIEAGDGRSKRRDRRMKGEGSVTPPGVLRAVIKVRLVRGKDSSRRCMDFRETSHMNVVSPKEGEETVQRRVLVTLRVPNAIGIEER